jgi:hypothetical protein
MMRGWTLRNVVCGFAIDRILRNRPHAIGRAEA